MTTDKNFRKDAFLFGEAQGRAVVSIHPNQVSELESFCATEALVITKLGEVKGKTIVIDGQNFGTIDDYKHIHLNAIHEKMNG